MFELEVSEISSLNDYQGYAFRMGEKSRRRETAFRQLVENSCSPVINGYCCVCKADSQFILPSILGNNAENVQLNWREELECTGCHLNNRKRAAFHLFELFGKPQPESDIYVTERRSPFYLALLRSFPKTIGSEYHGNHYPYGEEHLARMDASRFEKIRNETITALTFESDRFDFIFCLEVFEHIPDYGKGLSECCRCLKKMGKLFFTVPFDPNSQSNNIRAKPNSDGSIQHLLSPEYHGDPEQEGGILAYYNFGWDLLEEMRDIGFRKVTGLFHWSLRFAYLGRSNIVFMAKK
jgi:SAM-dependent methyltransferase